MNGPVIAIHQPNLLPWLGYLDKWDRADQFIVLDVVQLTRRSNTVRVNVLQNGRVTTLSVPIKHTGSQELAIRDAEIAEPAKSCRRIATTLTYAYRSCPHWKELGEPICAILAKAPSRLLELNLALLNELIRFAGIGTDKLRLQSELKYEGKKSALMASLTRNAGGRVYLSGGHEPTAETPTDAKTYTAADYNDPAVFRDHGVELRYQNFQHPVYPQMQAPFQPGLSSFDALVRNGPEVMKLVRRANSR